MANEKPTTAASAPTMPQWMLDHLPSYLASGGAHGHILDFRSMGGHWLTPHLLLKTVGRKTGITRIAPLIYGVTGGEAVIVASKGGADAHPGWYINIRNSNEVEMQIATQAYRAAWREPQGAERKRVWDYMVSVYPPYAAYQQRTQREIPLVLLKPSAETAVFR